MSQFGNDFNEDFTMRLTNVLAFLAVIAAISAFSTTLSAADKSAPAIILKLDDVTASGTRGNLPVPPRWQRVVDFIEKEDIKASFGIIGFSLEQDNAAYFDWIKNLQKKGRIEFWHHGYRNRKGDDKTGEFEESYEVQLESLKKTQKLAKEKLGIELKAFGPHWSGTTADTEKALAQIPELTMWFYGPKDSKKFVFPRYLTIENPTFVPDFDKFKDIYERSAHAQKCLALQGHPNAWDDKRWDGFVKIIGFLKEKGCRFTTPSEYFAEVKGGK